MPPVLLRQEVFISSRGRLANLPMATERKPDKEIYRLEI